MSMLAILPDVFKEYRCSLHQKSLIHKIKPRKFKKFSKKLSVKYSDKKYEITNLNNSSKSPRSNVNKSPRSNSSKTSQVKLFNNKNCKKYHNTERKINLPKSKFTNGCICGHEFFFRNFCDDKKFNQEDSETFKIKCKPLKIKLRKL